MNKLLTFLKKKFIYQELNKRLLYSYGFLFSVVLLLILMIQYYVTTSFFSDRVLTSNSETIEQTIVTFQQYVDDVEMLMFNIATNQSIQNSFSSYAKITGREGALEAGKIVNDILSVDVFSKKTAGVYLFSDLQKTYPVYRTSSIHMPSGQSGTNAVFRSDEIMHRAWYKEATEAHGKVLWRELEWDETRGKAEFSANRMIINAKNLRDSLGMIRVFVSPDYFQKILDRVTLGTEGKVYMYAGGDLLNYSDKKSLIDIIDTVMTMGKEPAIKQINGSRCYLISKDIGVADWKLVGIIPESSIYDQFAVLKNGSIIIFGLAIMLTIFLSRIIAASIAKPIQSVAYAMQNYENNSKMRFTEVRNDEVGILFKNYNRMMDYIEMLMYEAKERLMTQRRAELRALQAQINPHFLYNTLDCITGLAIERENYEIAELARALSGFFRISLNKGQEELTLRKEIEHVKSYCVIQKHRFKNKFTLSIEVPEELMNYKVIRLTLQPLVENSILHGFAKIDYTGEIIISAQKDESCLYLSVRDNGEGADVEYINGILDGEYRSSSNDTTSSGYGIINVNERIKLAFGDQSELHYSENDDGYGITATILLHHKEE